MRTVGIIAEYNPFHTGHAYHLRKAKELAGADFAVVVMSPDFVQRGEPAVFDKYTRARMALLGGADLVLELPVCYASGSAEYFARGAVALLNGLGVVDALCFGSETAEISLFRQAAKLLTEEPPQYRTFLREGLRQGLTFPRARAAAADRYLKAPEIFSDLLASPNNILGVEYCKALYRLRSPMEPIPIKRVGSSFHSVSLDGHYCSATALRQEIRRQSENSDTDRTDCLLLSYIPESCRDLFLDSCGHIIISDDFLPVLNERLLSAESFSHILDISEELSDRIRKLRFSCVGKSFEELVSLLKTKQITESRVRRALTHLVLGITAKDMEEFCGEGIPYARLLGFRPCAAPLLHEIKKRSAFPLLTKVAGASDSLSPAARKMWELDLFSSHLYHALRAGKYREVFRSEYKNSPIRG